MEDIDNNVLEDGTEIVVLEDDHKGEYGIILGYDPVLELYAVELPNLDKNAIFYFNGDLLGVLEEEETEDDEYSYEQTPGFGMSTEDFAAHLEFLIGRSLHRVPTVGPETAFFGYQEFEGLTAEDALLSLLDKIEEGIAHLAQAHILVARIGVTYRTLIKEITGDATEEDNDD